MACWLPAGILSHLSNGGPRDYTARFFLESAPFAFTLASMVAGPITLRPLVPIRYRVAFVLEGHPNLGPFSVGTGRRIDVVQQRS